MPWSRLQRGLMMFEGRRPWESVATSLPARLVLLAPAPTACLPSTRCALISATAAGERRLAQQEALARGSRRGRHLIARNSGHWIPLDEPAIVVAAVRDVVRDVRSKLM